MGPTISSGIGGFTLPTVALLSGRNFDAAMAEEISKTAVKAVTASVAAAAIEPNRRKIISLPVLLLPFMQIQFLFNASPRTLTDSAA
jgi:hypothetical protein